MKNIVRLIGLFILCVCLSPFANPRPAAAQSSFNFYYPGSACAQGTNPVTGMLSVNIGHSGNVAPQTYQPAGLTLYCPLFSNGSTISGVGFFGISNGASNISAAVCTINPTTGTPTCGATVYVTNPGPSNFYNNVSYSAYNNTQANYLRIQLSNVVNNTNNDIFGYAWSLSAQ